jgi:hypothetical protein
MFRTPKGGHLKQRAMILFPCTSNYCSSATGKDLKIHSLEKLMTEGSIPGKDKWLSLSPQLWPFGSLSKRNCDSLLGSREVKLTTIRYTGCLKIYRTTSGTISSRVDNKSNLCQHKSQNA